jgi:hypothetical protein
VLGPTTSELIAVVKEVLIHLGDLNDARMHIEMLDKPVKGKVPPGAILYRQVKQAELERLMADFSPFWSRLMGREWRTDLATAISVL